MSGNKQTIQVEKLDNHMKANSINGGSLQWHDPKQSPFKISGFAWLKEEQGFRRLPKQPRYEVTEAVDILANCTAGGQLRFRTNSQKLAVKVTLQGKANMFHMPATGQCGFDCYIGEPGEQRFAGVTKYDHTQEQYEVTLFERQEEDSVLITLNFPLYQGVKELSIGLQPGATIQSPPAYKSRKRLIFYGTSILQGGCASRPGMAYTNILSRKFNREFINLGFSGNGKGEANMAKLIREIEDPACLVLDYEPNCVSTALYKETLPRFIQLYREAHSEIPILVISKYPYAHEIVNSTLRKDRLERRSFQQQLVQDLQRAGDQHLYFYDGTDILGENAHEKTVDGSHATDLGFISMAEKLTPVFQEILSE
ncbi:hydrolase [Bacillus sp. J14TS2]|uniref:SGNH/GDSL hydrolase family protein n=1 Tax=Bacillus sp. J14TS2 TaxID=2807188 RepID=UPI001B26EDE4|nr:SGNH/GDSL hydrolase family protein [Bacillus sp. J14TS2]GIN69972.1 hydrolase [Bacillus sp. J14TS2]